MIISPYTNADRLACLSLFDGNTPRYFAEGERTEYEAFLDQLPGPYFVGVVGGALVAAGGYALSRTGDWVLCWGMVDARHHGSGLGRAMLAYRLGQLAEKGVTTAVVHTSARSAGFFERFGFERERVVSNGIAPGLDLHCLRVQIELARSD